MSQYWTADVRAARGAWERAIARRQRAELITDEFRRGRMLLLAEDEADRARTLMRRMGVTR